MAQGGLIYGMIGAGSGIAGGLALCLLERSLRHISPWSYLFGVGRLLLGLLFGMVGTYLLGIAFGEQYPDLVSALSVL